jgi:hypothetical protein
MCFTRLSPFNLILQRLAGECMWKIERTDLGRARVKRWVTSYRRETAPGPSWAIGCLVRIRPQLQRKNGESSAHPTPGATSMSLWSLERLPA